MRLCKDWLQTYCHYTSGQESPGIFHYWTGISQIVSTLCRSTWVDMGYFKFYPNMYLVIVGPTGVGKSTASDMGVDLFMEAFPNKLVTRGKISVAKLIEDMGEEYMLCGTARAYVYASEFKVFTSALSTNTSLIEDLTDLYGCPGKWSYRTKNRGVVSLENVCVNILGASIPDWLCTTSGENFINTGFAARILYIGAAQSDRLFHKPRPPKGALQLKEDLIHDLQEIAKLQGEYKITPEADRFHEQWYLVAKAHDVLIEKPEKLHGYIMRKDAHMLKLAMAIKAAKSDDMVLTEADLRESVAVLESIESGMMIAYQAIAFSGIEAMVQKVLTLIKNSKEGMVTHRDIMRRALGYKGFGGKGIDEVIEYMVKSDFISPVATRKNSFAYRLKFPEEQGLDNLQTFEGALAEEERLGKREEREQNESRV
jgi:hypothetical protein